MINKIIFTLIYIITLSEVSAQSVSNVVAKQEGEQITIEYDLNGLSENEMVNASILYSKDQENFQTIRKGLTGDVGLGIKTNGKKKVKWNVLKEHDILEGKYSFKVKVIVNKIMDKKGVTISIVSVKRIKNTLVLNILLNSDKLKFFDISQARKTHFVTDEFGNEYYINRILNNGILLYGVESDRLILSPNTNETLSLEIDEIPYGFNFIDELKILDKSKQEVFVLSDISI